MSDSSAIAKCPACGGDDLKDGRVGTDLHTFVPADRSFWTLSQGYRASAFVCLGCGFFGHFLPAESLKQLRAES